MKRLVLLAALNGCAVSNRAIELPLLTGKIEIKAPTGWSPHDSENPHTLLQWTAPSESDVRGTSVLVARVERSPLARATDDELGRWLVEQQRKLPNASFGLPIPFVTSNGFPGVRIEGEFVPLNDHAAYRRLHAVIVDGTALIHFIYTANQVDRESFGAVVENFSRRGP